jgi:hypothetical protein
MGDLRRFGNVHGSAADDSNLWRDAGLGRIARRILRCALHRAGVARLGA